MCLISLLGKVTYQHTFGRPTPSAKKKTKSSSYLMGPNEDRYFENKKLQMPIFKALPFEKRTLQSEDGLTLSAHYYRNGDSNRTAVLIHGFQSSGLRGYAEVGQRYIREGYNLLLPDNRSCGESEGEYTTFGVMESRDTLRWVLNEIELRPGCEIVLHGTSLGGATVCTLSGMELPENVKAIVSDCGFSELNPQIDHMYKVLKLPFKKALKRNVLKRFKKAAGFDIAAAETPLRSIARAKVPMIIVHGEADRYVPVQHAHKLFEACGSEKKELYIVPDVGHSAACLVNPDEYDRRVFGFLNEALAQ